MDRALAYSSFAVAAVAKHSRNSATGAMCRASEHERHHCHSSGYTYQWPHSERPALLYHTDCYGAASHLIEVSILPRYARNRICRVALCLALAQLSCCRCNRPRALALHVESQDMRDIIISASIVGDPSDSGKNIPKSGSSKATEGLTLFPDG